MYPDAKSVVLITDITTRKSFDLANIFRHRGIGVLLCDDLKGFNATVLSAAYGADIEPLSKDNFDEDLMKIVKKYSDKRVVYFPVEEDTTLKMYDFLKNNRVSNLFTVLPPKESFDIVRDKKIFSAFCIQNDIDVPREYDIKTLYGCESLPSKLIIKPKNGSGAIGIKYIDSKERLKALDLDFKEYVIQQRIKDEEGVRGAFFLFEKGRLIGFYGHRRIRTYPSSGGVSVYSKCHLDKELKKSGEKLLKKLNWSGIAMVEFLYDKESRSYKVIEVNPRAWGSIMLSEFCGSAMLQNFCASALKEEKINAKIETEKYIRWFFPWDFILYIQSGGKIENFWKFDKKNCCYINFTYAPLRGALLFTLFNMLNPKKIAVLLKKVLQK